MDDTNDQAPAVEEVEELETPEAEVTDWEAEAKKARAMAARYRNQVIKAKEAKKTPEPVKSNQKGELDNGDYALLAAKGIEEEEEVEFISNYMKKWDKPLRDVLRDSDIQAKLKGMRLEREVKQAMPSATKRASNGQIDNIDYWVSKYDQTGELPDNFEIAAAVINAKVERSNPSLPPWRRK